MNLSIVAVLLVCLYQQGVEGVESLGEDGVCTRICNSGNFPIDQFRHEKSVIVTLNDFSSKPERTLSVSLVVNGEEGQSAMNSLIRATSVNKLFDFRGSFTPAEGFIVSGFLDVQEIEDGEWFLEKIPKGSNEGVAITTGLEEVLLYDGDEIRFSYIPIVYLSFNVTTATMDEGSDLMVFMERTGDLSSQVQFLVYMRDVTASTDDYLQRWTEDEPATGGFKPGDSSMRIRLRTKADILTEGDETFEVVVVEPTVYYSSAIARFSQDVLPVTITDRKTAMYSFSKASYSVNEALTIPVTITKTGDLSITSFVHVATTSAGEATATVGTDYEGFNKAIWFQAGETEKTVDVTAILDSSTEGNEWFRIILHGGVSGAGILTAYGPYEITTVTIIETTINIG